MQISRLRRLPVLLQFTYGQGPEPVRKAVRCGQTIALTAIGDLPITLRTNSRFWRESVSTRTGRVCLERRRRGRDALGYPLWQDIRFNRIFCDSRIAAEASSSLLPTRDIKTPGQASELVSPGPLTCSQANRPAPPSRRRSPATRGGSLYPACLRRCGDS